MAGTPALVTLTGYLGKNPETRSTQERTYEGSRYNKVVDLHEPYEGHVAPRDYLNLSLGVHHGEETSWYDLKVWYGDLLCHRNIRFSGTGDLVTVVAWHSFYKLRGTDCLREQYIVQSFKRLRRSRKRPAPEIP